MVYDITVPNHVILIRRNGKIIWSGNCFGPNQSLQDPFRNLVGIFLNRILRGEPIYIFGNGHTRALSYVEDFLPCMIRAILNDSLDKEIINLGGKESATIDEIAQVVIDQFPEKKVEVIHTEPRYGEVPHAFSTFRRSEELLGYEERVGWKSGIERMANWAKKYAPNGKSWRFSPLALPTKEMPEPWRILHGMKD